MAIQVTIGREDLLDLNDTVDQVLLQSACDGDRNLRCLRVFQAASVARRVLYVKYVKEEQEDQEEQDG